MTLQEVIVSFLQRLGHGLQSDTISFDEVRQWPPDALSILLEEKIIEPAPPSNEIVCSGCPENCFKPVHILPGKHGKSARHFIACDENDYMGKIAVRPEQLQQWQITNQQLAVWIAKKLGLRSISAPKVSGEIPIGLMLNEKYRCQVALITSGIVSLRINQLSIPIVDIVYAKDRQVCIDQTAIESLANQGLSTAPKSEYQPSTVKREARKLETQSMYTDWQKAYRQLKREYPKMSDSWISKKIAKMSISQGRDSETIRKNMKG